MNKISLDNKGNVAVTRAAASTILAVPTPQISAPIPSSGMSMNQLLANYRAIIRAHAVYYPVAFQFIRLLGRGRQGVVYLGLRQGARGCTTEHAIKVFNPDLYRQPEEYWTDMGRIATQIAKLHAIQSPNLVSGYSYEETYGIGYAQMEAIDGMDLRRFVNPKQINIARSRCTPEEWARFNDRIFHEDGNRYSLQPAAVVHILRRVLRGLERLNSMNFLHCDIKPSNIMIDRLGYVKVIDFGRAIFAGERVTFLLGSPMYMAPEIHRREPGGFASDFFSLGLVGLELLRGEPLTNDADTDENSLLQTKMKLPELLSGLLPKHVRRRRTLSRIMRRLLEPNPANRYGSAEEAEAGDDGLIVVDKQLLKEGEEAEYRREFSDYLAKLIDPKTQRVETEEENQHSESSEVLTS